MIEYVRPALIVLAVGLFILLLFSVWRWHVRDDEFDLREYLTSRGRDGKQHVSRPALGEIVALFATTAAYATTIAERPQDFEICTLVYGGLWVVRGAYSTALKSKQDKGALK